MPDDYVVPQQQKETPDSQSNRCLVNAPVHQVHVSTARPCPIPPSVLTQGLTAHIASQPNPPRSTTVPHPPPVRNQQIVLPSTRPSPIPTLTTPSPTRNQLISIQAFKLPTHTVTAISTQNYTPYRPRCRGIEPNTCALKPYTPPASGVQLRLLLHGTTVSLQHHHQPVGSAARCPSPRPGPGAVACA